MAERGRVGIRPEFVRQVLEAVEGAAEDAFTDGEVSAYRHLVQWISKAKTMGPLDADAILRYIVLNRLADKVEAQS